MTQPSLLLFLLHSFALLHRIPSSPSIQHLTTQCAPPQSPLVPARAPHPPCLPARQTRQRISRCRRRRRARAGPTMRSRHLARADRMDRLLAAVEARQAQREGVPAEHLDRCPVHHRARFPLFKGRLLPVERNSSNSRDRLRALPLHDLASYRTSSSEPARGARH